MGKIIINEQHKPNKLTSAVGGVAGGEKFIAQGLFFKYPTDKFIESTKSYLYGGVSPNHEFSSNASNHYLKGLT